MNGRKKRLSLRWRIKEDGSWTKGEDQLVQKVVSFYKEQFTRVLVDASFSLVYQILVVIPMSNINSINIYPSKKEIKRVVFKLNGDSASGPYGRTNIFYQNCWDIVECDIINAAHYFFDRVNLPKSITHTNIVLLP